MLFCKKNADIPISLKEYLDIESKLEVNNFHSTIAQFVTLNVKKN